MDKVWLEERVAEGMSQRAIAVAASTSHTNIRYWLRTHGLTTVVARPIRPVPTVFERVLPVLPNPVAPKPGVLDSNALSATTESAVLAGLTAAGFACYIPFGVTKADLVIETMEGLRSVQCKTASLKHNNTILTFQACTSLRAGGTASYRGLVDYFAVACTSLPGEVFLIPVADVGTTLVHLRLVPTANAQRRGVRFASDYRIGGWARLSA